jgi:hypothetical protein
MPARLAIYWCRLTRVTLHTQRAPPASACLPLASPPVPLIHPTPSPLTSTDLDHRSADLFPSHLHGGS